jgi:3-deoxy-alpha-D-manno-octulosonate 8-oxidase
LVDRFFNNQEFIKKLQLSDADKVYFIPTELEPTTDFVDDLFLKCKSSFSDSPVCVVGVGGGITLDVAKAISNLFGNPGPSENYQGWDLLKNPGVFKIGVPTVSGTGAEASRTCVLLNTKKNLKLGMNSEFTIYDQLILDPDLIASVPREQYFYTGMDTYIHCVESLSGSFRHPVGDAFSREALRLADEVFNSSDMMSLENREKIMVASYLGGCAIANSFVGVVHPFSAGLSVVLGLHHCIANCLVMNVMDEFYPIETVKFREMIKKQRIEMPTKICHNLSESQFEKLYQSTIIHEKPLTNALGNHFRDELTFEKVSSIFKRI